MNVRIYSPWKNQRMFRRMNIFVLIYSNILEYPDICPTLQHTHTKNSIQILYKKLGCIGHYLEAVFAFLEKYIISPYIALTKIFLRKDHKVKNLNIVNSFKVD